jgi:hypothetical protein
MTPICQDDQRRAAVRDHRDQHGRRNLNGLDYLEVGDDLTTLTVYFLGKLPRALREDQKTLTKQVRIEGGRRIRDVKVVDVEPLLQDDPELDDALIVRVDKPGDHSTYSLRIVGLDGIDPRYDHVDFSFLVDCPSDLDCRAAAPCPPPTLQEPEISYLAKDYASFRQLILDRLALLMPGWRERHVPDIGIALVEVLAYVGDYLSYYQDAVGTEAYLDTARRRVSVRRHARLVDYTMHEGCNARAWVCVETDDTLEVDPREVAFVTSPPGVAHARPVLLSTDPALRDTAAYEVFEPLVANAARPIVLAAGHGEIRFYTWGEKECCLPHGATSATLLDGWDYQAEPPAPKQEQARRGAYAEQAPRKQESDRPAEIDPKRLKRRLNLHPGDVLILEEVMGSKTGSAADADPAHRHAVRLIRVEPGEDRVFPQKLTAGDADVELPTPVLEVEWAPEDALPFPLCLSAIASNVDCRYLDHVSVARGNVILVDHGRTIRPPVDLGVVPQRQVQPDCVCEGYPADAVRTPGRFRPRLPDAPLTYAQPLPAGRQPAATLLAQDVRKALPQVWLSSVLPGQTAIRRWEPRYDLLASGPDDPHVVVEIEDDGSARLRFGNGELGEQPAAQEAFSASYRIGNGPSGNAGAEAIAHVVFAKGVPGDRVVRVRNPLPASGGAEPESMAEVKLLAPTAFRKTLERAITADDYARLAERTGGMQRAAAELAWTGSWYEADVAVDALGRETPDKQLLAEVTGSLRRYRRIGHDLAVKPARHVPLAITLEVCVLPGLMRGHVEAALLAVFGNHVLPDGRLGVFHPDNLTFGEGIYLSKLVAAAQAVPGVESVRVTRLQRLFEEPNGELENGLLPLRPDEIAQLDDDPDFPEHGQLELVMKGGR